MKKHQLKKASHTMLNCCRLAASVCAIISNFLKDQIAMAREPKMTRSVLFLLLIRSQKQKICISFALHIQFALMIQLSPHDNHHSLSVVWCSLHLDRFKTET